MWAVQSGGCILARSIWSEAGSTVDCCEVGKGGSHMAQRSGRGGDFVGERRSWRAVSAMAAVAARTDCRRVRVGCASRSAAVGVTANLTPVTGREAGGPTWLVLRTRTALAAGRPSGWGLSRRMHSLRARSVRSQPGRVRSSAAAVLRGALRSRGCWTGRRRVEDLETATPRDRPRLTSAPCSAPFANVKADRAGAASGG